MLLKLVDDTKAHAVLTFDLFACQVLTNDNFDSAVSRYDILLVEFYAPWCGFCKKLKPEYEKISTDLKKEDYPIGVGKVDVTKEDMVGDRYKVESYPQLKVGSLQAQQLSQICLNKY
jgi:protein disulfide-isomerase-like protein